MTSAAVQATPAPSPTVTVQPAESILVATSQASDTTSSSVTNRGASTPETARSTSITMLRMVPAADGRSLEVWVDNVGDLYAVDIEIKFDPARLQVADADTKAEGVQVQPGQAPTPDFVAINDADNEKGVIRYVATQLGEVAAFSGGGVIATIRWQSPAVPSATISLESAMLVNKDVLPIEFAVKQ